MVALMHRTRLVLRHSVRQYLKDVFSLLIICWCATSSALAASQPQTEVITLWKRHLASQLVAVISRPEFKVLATDSTQFLYVRFRIDESGKAQSITFTETSDAEAASKIAVQRMISKMVFKAPPPGANIKWLVLPVIIQARQPEALQPLPD